MWTKVQKSKMSPTSRAGPSLEGHARSGRLSKPAEQCLGDRLTLELPPFSHSGGLRGSEWHNAVSPA